MKILIKSNEIILEEYGKIDKLTEKQFSTANEIISIINRKESPLDYFQNLALKKLDSLKEHDLSLDTKIKKIFTYIHWYYVAISNFLIEEGIKISIPNQFTQFIDSPELIYNIELLICGDNPGDKEFQDDIGFNPNGKAGAVLNTILQANFSDIRKSIIFFNKTFISTNTTKQLSKINNQLVIKTTEFNAKIINLLTELLDIKALILGGHSFGLFDKFFELLSNNSIQTPHTSYYKIFSNNKNIQLWDEKINSLKEKYEGKDIFTRNGNLSFKKINLLPKQERDLFFKDFFQKVIL